MWITLRTASDFYSNFITDAYSKKATESKSQINQLLNQSPKDIAQTNKPLISSVYLIITANYLAFREFPTFLHSYARANLYAWNILLIRYCLVLHFKGRTQLVIFCFFRLLPTLTIVVYVFSFSVFTKIHSKLTVSALQYSYEHWLLELRVECILVTLHAHKKRARYVVEKRKK